MILADGLRKLPPAKTGHVTRWCYVEQLPRYLPAAGRQLRPPPLLPFIGDERDPAVSPGWATLVSDVLVEIRLPN